MTLTVMKIS